MPRSKPHYRVTIEDAQEAHERALEFGGHNGVLNLNGVESAIARPYSGYYKAISKKAAVIIQSLVANHGFVDGNKRTALICVTLMIERSGYEFTNLSNEEANIELERIILSAADGTFDLEATIRWFKRYLKRSKRRKAKR